MSEETTRKIAYWVAWTGPAWVVCYLVTWGIMGHNYPCPSQALTGQELVDQYYAKYRGDIMLGMALSASVGILYMPWSIVLSYQMWQRENVPLLSLMQLTGGVLTAFLIVVTAAMWTWCARWAGTPGIDPELTKAVHLSTWYVFDMTYNVTNVQLLGCGLFAILDRRKPAIFPAWLGWFALFTGVSFVLETIMPYYDHGPLAINGWWNFNFGFAVWFVWFCLQSVYVLREASRTRVRPAAAIGQAIGVAGSH
jgi:hypothetical protein